MTELLVKQLHRLARELGEDVPVDVSAKPGEAGGGGERVRGGNGGSGPGPLCPLPEGAAGAEAGPPEEQRQQRVTGVTDGRSDAQDRQMSAGSRLSGQSECWLAGRARPVLGLQPGRVRALWTRRGLRAGESPRTLLTPVT